jgi:ribose-phosphate pyrophosphokinase
VSRVVFSTAPYAYLEDALVKHPGFTSGQLTRKTFPDGERSLRIGGEMRGKDVVVLGGTFSDAATLELFDLAVGLVGLGVNTLSLVIPYFGYSTQERATRHGEVVTAKARAVLLSAIPRARLTNEAILIDLHTPGITHYFEGHLHSTHLSAHALPLKIVQEAKAKGPVMIGCTDAGRAKWVQNLANEAGVQAAFVYKTRAPDGKTSVTGINADVQGKHVLLYDDIVRTGGSLLGAAEAYEKAGAAKITALVTHAVLPGDALAKIQGSGLFEALHATDSLPRARELEKIASGFLKIQELTPLIAAHFS